MCPHKLPIPKWWASTHPIKVTISRICVNLSVKLASSRGAPLRNHNTTTIHQQFSHSRLYKITMLRPATPKPESKSRIKSGLKTAPEWAHRRGNSPKQPQLMKLVRRTNKTTAHMGALDSGSMITKNSSLLEPAHTKRLSCTRRKPLCLWWRSRARSTSTLT